MFQKRCSSPTSTTPNVRRKKRESSSGYSSHVGLTSTSHKTQIKHTIIPVIHQFIISKRSSPWKCVHCNLKDEFGHRSREDAESWVSFRGEMLSGRCRTSKTLSQMFRVRTRVEKESKETSGVVSYCFFPAVQMNSICSEENTFIYLKIKKKCWLTHFVEVHCGFINCRAIKSYTHLKLEGISVSRRHKVDSKKSTPYHQSEKHLKSTKTQLLIRMWWWQMDTEGLGKHTRNEKAITTQKGTGNTCRACQTKPEPKVGRV